MRKTDKKIDNSLRKALTDVCEIALEKYDGFKWLTHFASYSSFPGSLSILCVFDTNTQLSTFLGNSQDSDLLHIINEHLASIDINLKNIRQHVSFDTEENCTNDNDGKWHERFK